MPSDFAVALAAARPVLQALGLLVTVLGLAMLLPAIVDAAVGNPDWRPFVASSALTAAAGGTLALATRGGGGGLGVRQAFVLTTLAWLLISAFGAVPFVFGVGDMDYADAFFESVSGLTTTGSTVLAGLDAMPPGLLLWRGLLHWLGGIGIIAMAILILPYLRVGGLQLFRMESSDRSEKVLPRAGQFTLALTAVYVLLTAACAIAYRWAGMSTFDAVVHAMATISTGGFGTRDDSMAGFPPATHAVGIVFMLLGAMPFAGFVRVLRGEHEALWRNSQVRAFLGFIALTSLGTAVWLTGVSDMGFLDSLRHATFNIVSIVTTTGFATADYQYWGPFAAVGFLLLTVVGGCTGSTAGGIKIFRFQVLAALLRQVLRRQVMPHGVFNLRYDGRPLSEDVVSSTVAFFFVFLATIAVLALALALLDLDMVTAISASATAVANVGPGLGQIVGPVGNFAILPDAAKWLLAFGMLLGRLELFTVFVLFSRRFWRN